MPFSGKTNRQHEHLQRSLPTAMSGGVKHVRQFFNHLLVPMHVRDFRLLFGGQLISNVGDMFYAVALPWFLLSNGGGAQTLSIVMVAYGIPRAASSLLGGVLSDRWSPRQVMLLSDSLRALLVGMLAWLAFVGHPHLWLLCLALGSLGTCAGLFLPASFSLIPDVLPEACLSAGNALSATATQLAILAGPVLAGLVVSHLQPMTGLALDAFSFVISALTLALMQGSRTPVSSRQMPFNADAEGAPEKMSLPDGAASSLSFWYLLRTSRFLQMILVLLVLGNFFGGGVGAVALPVFTYDRLQAGASGYSLIIAAFGIGALIGGVSASGLGRLHCRGVLVLLIWLTQSAAITLIPYAGIAFGVAGSALASAAEGLTNSLGNIIFRTIVQQHFPRTVLGRINGAFLFCEFSLYPLSVALAGVMVGQWGPLSIFFVNGVIGFFCMAYALSRRELREM